VPRYRDPESTLLGLVTAAGGERASRRITWRQGSRRHGGRPQMMSSRFVILRVRPAGRVLRRLHHGRDLPEAWLIAEWPRGSAEPVKYWLSNLPATIAKRTLVRWAKLRRRVEHDYREVKTGLGPDHYEAAPGPPGTTTSPSSRPLTPSAPCRDSTQKPLRRNDPPRRTPTPARLDRLPDRNLPDLQNRLPATETETRRRS
jgi:hypothetical protein